MHLGSDDTVLSTVVVKSLGVLQGQDEILNVRYCARKRIQGGNGDLNSAHTCLCSVFRTLHSLFCHGNSRCGMEGRKSRQPTIRQTEWNKSARQYKTSLRYDQSIRSCSAPLVLQNNTLSSLCFYPFSHTNSLSFYPYPSTKKGEITYDPIPNYPIWPLNHFEFRFG